MFEAFLRFHRGPLSVRLAVILWTALAVVVTVRVVVSKPGAQSVVPIYLKAGERWLRGESLYQPILWEDLFHNPPVVAVAFAGLTPLPEKVAGLLVRGVGLALFLTGMLGVRRTLLAGWSDSRAGWLAALALVLVVPAFNNGQLNLTIAGLGLLGVAAAAGGRWPAAAVWLGVAGWVKVYPLSLGLLVMLAAPRRFAAALLVVTLVGVALPFVADPAGAGSQFAEYAASLQADDRTNADPSRVPRDWTALPRSWLGWVPPRPVAQAVALAAAAAFAVTVWLRRDRPAEALLAALVGANVWMTAFGPMTEMNTYSLLAAVAPLVLLMPGLPRGPRMLAAAGYALLAVTVLRGMFPDDRDFHILGPQALGAIVTGVAYALQATRDTPG